MPELRCILGPPQFTRADFDPRKNFSEKASTSFANRAGKTESLWLYASSPIWTGFKANTKLPSLLLPKRWNWLGRWNPNVTPSSDCKRLSSLPAHKTGTNARPGCWVNLKLCGKKSARLLPLVTGPNMNAPLPGTARLWGKTRSRACEKKDAWPRSTGSTVKSREARPRPVYSAELCILKSCGITRIKFDKHHHSVRRVRLASPGPPHRANGRIQSR